MIALLVSIFNKMNKTENIEYIWKLRTRALKRGVFGLIYAYSYNKIITKCGSSVPLSANFVDMPSFPHGIKGIFISSGAYIGKSAVIFHQVTIGSNTLKDSKGNGAPEIGQNVYIGCGAKIIGNVKVGDNVRIGANCVITSDIPDNCTVVLEKPRIITRDTDGIRNNSFELYKKIDGDSGTL